MANYTSSHSGTWHDDQYIKSEIVDKIYPIGSIYMSVNSTSPATLFGGTWSQINNTFLIAQGSNYTAGSTGGATSHNHDVVSNDHTLIENELPLIDGYMSLHGQEHGTHVYNVSGHFYGSNISGMYQTTGQTNGAYSYGNVGFKFGNNQPHNHGTSTSTTESNLPPYLAVYMWQRTA